MESHMNDFNFSFHEMMRLYRNRAQYLAQLSGLNPGQPPVLLALHQKQKCTQKELSIMLHIKPASITDILQRMEKKGLVIREQDAADLRTSKVMLSEQGALFVNKVLEIGKELESNCFEGFSFQEKLEFMEFLKRITNNLSCILYDI